MTLARVLVANRGEIAVRVIRACADEGLETVVALSEADMDSLPAHLADRAVCIGPPSPSESYLDVSRVMASAVGTGCDAMGALGVSQGKRFRLHPPTLEFARHHGLEIKACQAGDAKRKGKCERPFRDLKESFLTDCDALGAPGDLVELNRRAELWLGRRIHARKHSTTGVAPAERLETERRFLVPLPRRRFDTAYVEDHRVHPKLPLVAWDGVSYSVPPEVVGQKVVCRVEVDSTTLEVCWGTTVIARHQLQPGATEAMWDPAHRAAAEAIALGRGRSGLRLVPALPPGPDRPVNRLELGDGDYDVDAPDLAARYGGCGCTGRGVWG